MYLECVWGVWCVYGCVKNVCDSCVRSMDGVRDVWCIMDVWCMGYVYGCGVWDTCVGCVWKMRWIYVRVYVRYVWGLYVCVYGMCVGGGRGCMGGGYVCVGCL